MPKSDDAKFAPVPLAAGSYDAVDLAAKLNAAIESEDRDAAVAEAVAAAQIDPPNREAPGMLPGYQAVDVEHPEIEGLVETTMVPAEAEAEAEANAPAAKAGGDAKGKADAGSKAGTTENTGADAGSDEKKD